MRYLLVIFYLSLLAPFRLSAQSTDWILNQQQTNGGWSDGFSSGSGAGITADVVIGLAAAGIDVTQLDPSPLTYLENYANQNAAGLSVALAAKFALVAVLFETDPHDFGGVDVLARMKTRSETTDLYGDSLFEHCLVLVAAKVADEPVSRRTTQQIIDLAHPEGGWGFEPEAEPDPVTSALCLQGIIAQGYTGEAIDPTLAYFRQTQHADGGWGQFSTETESYTTAWVIMALLAADQDLATWDNPQTVLETFLLPDGSYDYAPSISPEFDLFATAGVLPALAGKSWLDLTLYEP